jgi:hypothetical protein
MHDQALEPREKPTIGWCEIATAHTAIRGDVCDDPTPSSANSHAAFWLGTIATAEAQPKMTITVVTQPFGTQPQFTKVDQPICATD